MSNKNSSAGIIPDLSMGSTADDVVIYLTANQIIHTFSTKTDEFRTVNLFPGTDYDFFMYFQNQIIWLVSQMLA
jgi:hypothetical protein